MDELTKFNNLDLAIPLFAATGVKSLHMMCGWHVNAITRKSQMLT